jgi:hypothetical protein
VVALVADIWVMTSFRELPGPFAIIANDLAVFYFFV